MRSLTLAQRIKTKHGTGSLCGTLRQHTSAKIKMSLNEPYPSVIYWHTNSTCGFDLIQEAVWAELTDHYCWNGRLYAIPAFVQPPGSASSIALFQHSHFCAHTGSLKQQKTDLRGEEVGVSDSNWIVSSGSVIWIGKLQSKSWGGGRVSLRPTGWDSRRESKSSPFWWWR